MRVSLVPQETIRRGKYKKKKKKKKNKKDE